MLVILQFLCDMLTVHNGKTGFDHVFMF